MTVPKTKEQEEPEMALSRSFGLRQTHEVQLAEKITQAAEKLAGLELEMSKAKTHLDGLGREKDRLLEGRNILVKLPQGMSLASSFTSFSLCCFLILLTVRCYRDPRRDLPAPAQNSGDDYAE